MCSKCAACAFCLDGFDSSSASKHPMLGLNASEQLLRIVAAFDKRFGARSTAPPPPPRALPPLPRSAATGSTSKHGPLISNSASANGAVSSSLHAPLTFGEPDAESSEASPKASGAAASAQMLAALGSAGKSKGESATSGSSSVPLSPVATSDAAGTKAPGGGQADASKAMAAGRTGGSGDGDDASAKGIASGHASAAAMAKAAAEAAASRASAAASSLTAQPSLFSSDPGDTQGGQGPSPGPAAASEEKHDTYTYLLWTFCTVGLVLGGLYGLFRYSHHLAAHGSSGKPRRLPTSEEEAEEEEEEIGQPGVQTSVKQRNAEEVEVRKRTEAEEEKRKAKSAAKVAAKAAAKQTAKQTAKGASAKQVATMAAGASHPKTQTNGPSADRGDARTSPPPNSALSRAEPLALSPVAMPTVPRLPPPPINDVLTASLAKDLIDDDGAGARGPLGANIGASRAPASWVDDEGALARAAANEEATLAARRGRMQAHKSKAGVDLD